MNAPEDPKGEDPHEDEGVYLDLDSWAEYESAEQRAQLAYAASW